MLPTSSRLSPDDDDDLLLPRLPDVDVGLLPPLLLSPEDDDLSLALEWLPEDDAALLLFEAASAAAPSPTAAAGDGADASGVDVSSGAPGRRRRRTSHHVVTSSSGSERANAATRSCVGRFDIPSRPASPSRPARRRDRGPFEDLHAAERRRPRLATLGLVFLWVVRGDFAPFPLGGLMRSLMSTK